MPKWKPSRVRQLSIAEAAWVGAMIEAEGTVWALRKTTRCVGISVGNTDVEIISTLLRFVGDGRVKMHAPGAGDLGRKTAWFWELTHDAAIRALAPQITPWMTVKGDRLIALL